MTDTAATANQFLGIAGDGTGALTNGTDSTTKTHAGDTSDNAFFISKGATDTGTLTFNAIQNGSDTQTLNFNAVDTSGGTHPVAISLNAGNAGSLDQAIETINTQLQKTNDSSLQQIAAVKVYDPTSGGSYGINFISTISSFNVSLGQVGDGKSAGIGSAASGSTEGTVVTAKLDGAGSTVNITNQAAAQTAVTALGNAVANLGKAQAVVGRGENEFAYATNLAQSELTNTQTAEAGIRDADLASEAANLTKAQILVQAGVAALAQANSAPQQVLSLLRG